MTLPQRQLTGAGDMLCPLEAWAHVAFMARVGTFRR